MSKGIVSTIGQKCKRCYSCIRECPAIAIRVVNGQAVVIEDRCISCGHCLKVCSQQAKQIKSDIEIILEEILTSGKAVAIIAPSFAASFPESYLKLPAALRLLGFKAVTEAAFGADLIGQLYSREMESFQGKTIISSACPAVYNYIEKYVDELVPNLATIVSPMIAMGRYLKANLGEDIKVVFIGPCVAKKSEYIDDEVSGAIDAVLTFTELKEIFRNKGISPSELQDSDFDPPHSSIGKVFPLAGGLLKTAAISNDILAKEIIVVEGKDKVLEIINEIANGNINSKFVDILFCEGCISGPAIDSDLNYYSRREKVIKYCEEKINTVDKHLWKSNLFNSRNINFRRNFSSKNQRKPMPSEEKIKEILARSNKFEKKDELNCTACGYVSCREYAVAIAKGLAEDEMCLPFLIEKLENAYDELKNTQEQLHSAEKLASIGQLAAGVAHEINNPLGTILLYSSMLRNEWSKVSGCNQYTEDLNMIIDETNRCKNIVANLLNFARQGKLRVSKINVWELLSKIIKTFSVNPVYRDVKINLECTATDPVIEADADQIKEVFLNVLNNAFESFEDKKDKNVSVSLRSQDEYLSVEFSDTGCGIVKENISKLFTPFFTTKKMGKGTGLGLAIAYGIVKMHRGDIAVQSKLGEGTKFTIKLPTHLNNTQTIMN
ncbi:MAG: GHKL domain-containing protein [Ignavibacteria bacterium]|nr:GHKL domain-containing protein [Ignavibacteria bacterium]MCU7503849.1 GHKL domain-containing protein [Ignavibacteria bacterium]MCU7515930.1 GHKL domain-containing protein [Ignavibacteria bacterium]